MNLKIVWHLFKHGLALKKVNYINFIITIAVLVTYKALSNFYHFPSFFTFAIPCITVILSVFLVAKGALIPSESKTAIKGQGGHYTWGYILSTVRFPKALLLAYIVETFFDSILLIIISVIAFPKLEWGLTCSFVSIYIVILVRLSNLLTGLRGVKVRGTSKNEKSKNINSKKIIYALVAIGFLLISSDKVTSFIPSLLLLYIFVPIVSLFILYLPFLIYRLLLTDYNKKERARYAKKQLVVIGSVVLVSLIVFYNGEVKSGYIIFNEISEGNIKQVENLLHKHKNVLQIKGIETKLTPLLFAAKQNQPEIVKLILENGGNINETDHIGNNMLTFTALSCNYDLSEYLVKKGIKYNQMPSDNMNPLFDAAAVNCFPLIQYFRKLKMEEGAINKKGRNYIQEGSSRNPSFKSLYDFLFRNNLF